MTASSKYKLIVGLGNPGKEYRDTYHNAGILFLQHLSMKTKFKTLKNFEYAKIGDVIIVKPLTFMNESGKVVASAVKYFKIKTAELLIIHDDSDIELGKYKISAYRGSAGHRGIESIIKALKTKNFARLRIGVRKPKKIPSKRIKAGDFVLKRINKQDWTNLKSTFEKIKHYELRIFTFPPIAKHRLVFLDRFSE